MYYQLIYFAIHIGSSVVLVGSDNVRQQVFNASAIPYQVLISELDRPKCGGAIIHPYFVLTSASCILDFGSVKSFLQYADIYGGGVRILYHIGDILDAVIHPNYIINSISYDIAVVKFNPEGRGLQLKGTTLNKVWKVDDACIMTSWWSENNTWPDQMTWKALTPVQCTTSEVNMFCFTDENILFNKDDYGSPIVCDGVLRGLVPHGGGNGAINVTSNYDWIMDTMKELRKPIIETPDATSEVQTTYYLIEILHKLNNLTSEKKDLTKNSDDLGNWNNQIVIPLSYVLFAMVIFSFILLFFIIMFTVVLVYYSRK